MKNLIHAKANSHLIFVSANGGRGVMQRLTDMGLIPGEKLMVLHKSGFGPVTVLIKGAKVALGDGLAAKIIVKEE
ncbi:MAG: FeoA domain-containing protein [Candidatus Omnitrophica bacterium]|nr:FeoA domain-containing protein [Candidatus Omnitrophota bacterium]